MHNKISHLRMYLILQARVREFPRKIIFFRKERNRKIE